MKRESAEQGSEKLFNMQKTISKMWKEDHEVAIKEAIDVMCVAV